MARAYNNALVLVRFLAIYFLATGLMGLTYILLTATAFLGGVSRSLIDPALWFSIQGAFGNPIYIVAGLILLNRSIQIARFITKFCEPEEAA